MRLLAGAQLAEADIEALQGGRPLAASECHDYFQRELVGSTENPWEAFPLILASSQLVKRRERVSQLLDAKPWDLVLVDEAHHARRIDFLSGRYRRGQGLQSSGRPDFLVRDCGRHPAAHLGPGSPRYSGSSYDWS